MTPKAQRQLSGGWMGSSQCGLLEAAPPRRWQQHSSSCWQLAVESGSCCCQNRNLPRNLWHQTTLILTPTLTQISTLMQRMVLLLLLLLLLAARGRRLMLIQ
jgi:hypothetical protein